MIWSAKTRLAEVIHGWRGPSLIPNMHTRNTTGKRSSKRRDWLVTNWDELAPIRPCHVRGVAAPQTAISLTDHLRNMDQIETQCGLGEYFGLDRHLTFIN